MEGNWLDQRLRDIQSTRPPDYANPEGSGAGLIYAALGVGVLVLILGLLYLWDEVNKYYTNSPEGQRSRMLAETTASDQRHYQFGTTYGTCYAPGPEPRQRVMDGKAYAGCVHLEFDPNVAKHLQRFGYTEIYLVGHGRTNQEANNIINEAKNRLPFSISGNRTVVEADRPSAFVHASMMLKNRRWRELPSD